MIEIRTGTEKIDWDMLVELYCQVDGVIGLEKKEILKELKSLLKIVIK